MDSPELEKIVDIITKLLHHNCPIDPAFCKIADKMSCDECLALSILKAISPNLYVKVENRTPHNIFHELYTEYMAIGCCRGKSIAYWPNSYQQEFWERLNQLLDESVIPLSDVIKNMEAKK